MKNYASVRFVGWGVQISESLLKVILVSWCFFLDKSEIFLGKGVFSPLVEALLPDLFWIRLFSPALFIRAALPILLRFESEVEAILAWGEGWLPQIKFLVLWLCVIDQLDQVLGTVQEVEVFCHVQGHDVSRLVVLSQKFKRLLIFNQATHAQIQRAENHWWLETPNSYGYDYFNKAWIVVPLWRVPRNEISLFKYAYRWANSVSS